MKIRVLERCGRIIALCIRVVGPFFWAKFTKDNGSVRGA